MAASSGGGVCEAPVRLRLLFDYPPPGTPACGLCWLLLEPRQVRLVTDLSSLVRDKFGFSRRAKLSLFLDGALLPPTESARIVRDNDSLRVKLEEVIGEDDNDKIANGFGNQSKKQRKRHRQKLEVKDSDSEDEGHRKRKKAKWNFEHLSCQEESAANIQDLKALKKRKNAIRRSSTTDSGSDDSTCHSKKLKEKVGREKEQGAARDKKKKRKEKGVKMNNTSQKTNSTFSLSPSQKSATKTLVTKSGMKKHETSSDSSTSSSESDHSRADAKRKHFHQTKVASQHVKKPQLAASVKSAGKVATKQRGSDPPKAACSKKAKSPSSSSDSDSTSGEQEEPDSNNLKSKQPESNQGSLGGPSSRRKPKPSSSDSESSDSEASTAKKPKTNSAVSQTLGESGGKQLLPVTCGPEISPSDSRRGHGRGENPFWRGPRVRGCRGMIRGRGRGRGENPNFFHNYNGEQQKQQQLHETSTNFSTIIQNPPEAPKKDYSTLPLLAAPPQVGEKIAFKLLELTENYTPEVSDYKEGKIVSWDPTNKQLELEILSFSSVSKEPGKFDLVYQSADGAERIEYAVSHDQKITESWDALIEPRLIVDPPNNELGSGNGNS